MVTVLRCGCHRRHVAEGKKMNKLQWEKENDAVFAPGRRWPSCIVMFLSLRAALRFS